MKKVFGILLLVLFVCTSCGDKSEPSFKVYDEYSKEKKVEINEDGSIKILGYEKEQPYTVTKSLKKYLKTFRVDKEALADGRVKVGDQVVFLRYVVLK